MAMDILIWALGAGLRSGLIFRDEQNEAGKILGVVLH
jgi:hypothetical protein